MLTLAFLHGVLAGLPWLLLLLGALAAFLALGFWGAPLWAWTSLWAVVLWGVGAPDWLWLVLVVPPALCCLPLLRRVILSLPLLRMMKALDVLPVISETERTAIEAGTVWVDGDLFSGNPDLVKLVQQPYPDPKPEERAFLDGPVETVCRMTQDWEVFKNGDLPAQVWEYLKQERFFGMIIPREFGGLGFSASGNSAVVTKLVSRSLPLAITVMVPNSLGPAELLVHYGTPAQKEYWLPRLARGEEIPCFALTEPGAGSDAGSITSSGIVFRGEDGKLWLRLNWNKRYITLGAASTVLGLAFNLRDPENLLERGADLGITCALIPSATAGVVLGRRHDPLGIPFINSPTEGHDVVVPIDAIIGGPAGAGQGWRMLMECLAAGRGISLPATATGGAKLVARVAGAYAAVRKQFGLPIGKFEGIEEPLARIGAFTYAMDAVRRYTCGALDRGAKPAVVTAMVKYQLTELYRKAINDGMDVLGGSGISRGPRNLLAHGYMGTPISITVEGANILTRTLMIFGQGAIRCHPFAWREIRALQSNDLREFDAAFFGHAGHVVRNLCRSFLLSVTRGYLVSAPVEGPAARYFQKLSWACASFALLADLAMAALGGDLKRKEKITGRFADIFCWLYAATAVLRRFEADGRREADLPFFHFVMQHGFAQIQEAFDGLYQNLPVPFLGPLLRGPLALWSRINRIGTMPSDRLGGAVARAMQAPGNARNVLTAGMFMPREEREPLARLERAFELSVAAEAVARKIKDAVRAQKLPKHRPEQLVDAAVKAGVVTRADAELLHQAEVARADAVAVDSFRLKDYRAVAALAE